LEAFYFTHVIVNSGCTRCGGFEGVVQSRAKRTDEAMAKRLAAEWGSGEIGKSDEEMARELQA